MIGKSIASFESMSAAVGSLKWARTNGTLEARQDVLPGFQQVGLPVPLLTKTLRRFDPEEEPA
jgi:hypothetical protein